MNVPQLPFLFLLFNVLNGQFRFRPNIPFIQPSDCSDAEYFEPANISCVPCSEGLVSAPSRLSCICPVNAWISAYTPIGPLCKLCASDQRMIGGQCVTCPEGQCLCDPGQVWLNGNNTCAKCPEGTKTSDGLQCDPCDSFQCVCQDASCHSAVDTSSLSYNIRSADGTIKSSPFLRSEMPGAATRCALGSRVDCQELANMCVLQNFDREGASACNVYDQILRVNNWQIDDPLLYPASDADSELGKESVITHHFVLNNEELLDIVLGIYLPNGTFVGLLPARKSPLVICQENDESDAPFIFGRKFMKSCRLSIDELVTDQRQVLLEPFLRFRDDNGLRMYQIPIRNPLIRSNGVYINRLARESNRWMLTKRFFLVDQYTIPNGNGTMVTRFAAHIALNVVMQPTRDGLIFPPYIELDYAENLSQEDTVSVTFSVNYRTLPGRHDRDVEITMGVLGPASVVWAVLCTYSWGRRNGKQLLADVTTVIHLGLFGASALGDVFFIVTAAIVFWLTFCYKTQSDIFYSLPDDSQETVLCIYLWASICLKLLGLIQRHVQLAGQETFFIDWEKPANVEVMHSGRPVTSDITKERQPQPVVVWRTYLIANEWNELRNYRSTSLTVQLIGVIFVLEYMGWKNFALVESGFHTGQLSPSIQTSRTTEMAVVIFVYLLLGFVQWILQVVIIERIISDPFHNFIDLCSICNISVLTLTHSLFGYYIHGRSAHGKSDTDMKQMNEFLQRERDNLCGNRGLEPASELQTYTVALPTAFRKLRDEIMLTAERTRNRPLTSDHTSEKINDIIRAHEHMNTMLQELIDHQLSGVDYVIRDRSFVEALLDVETFDSSHLGHFMRDTSEIEFARCFVYGNEWAHISFECGLFCIMYLWMRSFILCATITFVISRILHVISSYFGTKHLIKHSLIDQRFLV